VHGFVDRRRSTLCDRADDAIRAERFTWVKHITGNSNWRADVSTRKAAMRGQALSTVLQPSRLGVANATGTRTVLTPEKAEALGLVAADVRAGRGRRCRA